jgi:hypothetical protein
VQTAINLLRDAANRCVISFKIAFLTALIIALHPKIAQATGVGELSGNWTLTAVHAEVPFCIAMKRLPGVGVVAVAQSPQGTVFSFEVEREDVLVRHGTAAELKIGERVYQAEVTTAPTKAFIVRGRDATQILGRLSSHEHLIFDTEPSLEMLINVDVRMINTLEACALSKSKPKNLAEIVTNKKNQDSESDDVPRWAQYDAALKSNVASVRQRIWRDWKEIYPLDARGKHGRNFNK